MREERDDAQGKSEGKERKRNENRRCLWGVSLGQLVLDVPPGGETYTFSCFSATHAGNPLKGEFGFIA